MPTELANKQKVGTPTEFMRKDGKFATLDPAEKVTPTQRKIIQLLKNPDELSAWEKKFLADIYGQEPLTRRQHTLVCRLFKKISLRQKGTKYGVGRTKDKRFSLA